MSSGYEYRGAFFVWIVSEVASVSSLLFLWLAVFRSQDTLGSYNLSTFVAYYLVVPFVGSISHVFVSDTLPKRIKDGDISKDLLRPYSLTAALFIEHLGVRVNQLLFKIPFFIILSFLLLQVFHYRLEAPFVLLGILSSLFSLVVLFFLDLLLSLASFWMDDVWALSHFRNVLLLVLGGQSFPLDLLPSRIKDVVDLLPFKFVYYVPTKIFLGQMSFSEIWVNGLQLLIWVCVLFGTSYIVFRLGVRRYGAYGG